SKKLGLENKQVLSKAKELGIAAKVASSSLDKITAEYLEQQLIQTYPESVHAASNAAPVETPVQASEPTASAPPPPPPETEVASELNGETTTAMAVLEPPPPAAESPAPPAEPIHAAPALEPVEAIAPPPPPAAPVQPA